MTNEKKTLRKAKQGKPIRQVAAVPVRLHEGRIEVMLVTSRGTKRFIVPKGWPMKGKSGREAALTEAHEEAGISGETRKAPLGRYRYWKRLSDAFVCVEVTVYLLMVNEVSDDWKEAGLRERAWLAPEDAATLIDEPELATLVRTLEQESIS
jgi:8-oxo-dGTP pyrophosphatase MutT (NUDIX family)